MPKIAYLRRHAVFCLRLAEFSSDPPLAAHLTSKPAQFHERALRAEFAAEFALNSTSMSHDLAQPDASVGHHRRH